MSLQVWLPLNGDLHNQGLNNFTITNNGATINNNGKIGKCYYFNGDKQWLQFSTSLGNFYNNDWSFAAWLKPTDSTRSVILSEYNGTGASNVAIELTTARVVRIYWNGSPDINFTTAGGLPINEWTHLIITKQSSIFKIYFNGILKQTYTYNGTLSTRVSNCQPRIGDDYQGNSTNAVSYQGYMNDFRLYDHALSAAEVAEIAKGLVLHYKLDDPNKNLLVDDWDLTKWNKESGISVIWDPLVNMYKVIDSTHTSSRWGIYQNLTLTANTTYTFSVDGMKKDQGTNLGFAEGTSWPANSTSFTTTMTRASKTITVGSADANCRIYLNINPVSGGANYGYFRAPKLELGNIATDWIPYNDENVIYDCSGYNNDGTVVGNLTAATGSPRYEIGTVFNGSNGAIKVVDNNWASQGREAMTINLWAKSSAWGGAHLFSCTESGGFNTEAGNSGNLRFPINVYTNAEKTSHAYKYDSNEIQLSALPTNEWIMLTFVYDSTGTKTYINGQLHHTYTNTSYGIYFNTNARLFLGCEASTASPTSPYFNGQESDFRMYATALTAEQILNLYNTSVSIDASGNTYARELKEV